MTKHLRLPVSAVYAFARSADDFADEGHYTQAQRLNLLDEYTAELIAIESAITKQSSLTNTETMPFCYASDNIIFIALADTIYHYQLPITLFHDLLSAFKQDVSTTRYNNFSEIIRYCHLSATPIGRILLHLNHSASDENLHYSDALCSALQLINFYQDIAQDMIKNRRLYLPLDEMKQLGISTLDIKNAVNNQQTKTLLNKQLMRTKEIYELGKPLCYKLTGRFALEIRTIYFSGLCILQKLENNTDNIYLRPRLTIQDKLKIIWQSLFFNILH